MNARSLTVEEKEGQLLKLKSGHYHKRSHFGERGRRKEKGDVERRAGFAVNSRR